MASAQAGEDEVFVTLGADYASRPNFLADSRGVGLSGGAFWGFHRWFSVGGLASYAHHFPLPSSNRATASDVLGAFVGLGFNVDIMEVVPFVSVAPGVLYDGTASFSVRTALGLDYRPNRRWAFGADVAWHAVFDGGASFPGYSVLRVRVSRVFDRRAL